MHFCCSGISTNTHSDIGQTAHPNKHTDTNTHRGTDTYTDTEGNTDTHT